MKECVQSMCYAICNSSLIILLFIVCNSACALSNRGEILCRPSKGKGGATGIASELQVNVHDEMRTCRIVVPKDMPASQPVPILFAFHAYHGSVETTMQEYTRLDDLSQKEGFILVYPKAKKPRWALERENNPDIIFFDTLLGYLSRLYNIDLNRVYAVGMSNGAYFVNLLASQRSEVIAAIAVHSGGLPWPEVSAVRKYPVMIIHGGKDKIIDVSEGRKMRDAYEREFHEVVYVEILDLGHTWAWEKYDINKMIWDFLKNIHLI